MTHVCVSKLTIIGSDNGLSPGWRQAIIWSNAGILLVRNLRNKFHWNYKQNSYIIIKKMHLNVSSEKWWPFCLGFNVLRYVNIFCPFSTFKHHTLLKFIPKERKYIHNCIQSISCLLMTWWCKEPGHQQPWYWRCYLRILWYMQQKGQGTSQCAIVSCRCTSHVYI